MTNSHGDDIVQACTLTVQSALTGICRFVKSQQGHFYFKGLLSFQSFYSFIQQILLANHVPSHPSLSQEDQHRETGTAGAPNPKGGW